MKRDERKPSDIVYTSEDVLHFCLLCAFSPNANVIGMWFVSSLPYPSASIPVLPFLSLCFTIICCHHSKWYRLELAHENGLHHSIGWICFKCVYAELRIYALCVLRRHAACVWGWMVLLHVLRMRMCAVEALLPNLWTCWLFELCRFSFSLTPQVLVQITTAATVAQSENRQECESKCCENFNAERWSSHCHANHFSFHFSL